MQENADADYNVKLSDDDLKDVKTTLPLRTSFDDLGASVVVAANYFELLLDSTTSVYKYRVALKAKNGSTPPITKRQRHRLLELLLRHQHFRSHGDAIATDYNETLYAIKELVSPHTLTLSYYEPESSAIYTSKEYNATLSLLTVISIAEISGLSKVQSY